MIKPRANGLDEGGVEEFLDCTGKQRRFLLRVYGNGQFIEACEILGEASRGLRIVLPVKPGAPSPYGEIRKRIRERLARREVVRDNAGRLVLVADGLRGRLTLSADGVALIVDDLVLSWDEVATLLESHEGFGIRLEICEPGKE